MKTLLIVFHTGGVKTAKMAEAVERGARTEQGVRVVMKRCAEAGPASTDNKAIAPSKIVGLMALSVVSCLRP